MAGAGGAEEEDGVYKEAGEADAGQAQEECVGDGWMIWRGGLSYRLSCKENSKSNVDRGHSL